MQRALEHFFTTMRPFLLGDPQASVEQVEAALGPSPSGREALDFYRVLVARNYDKILRELFPALRRVVERELPGRWPALVREYAHAHACAAHDPNHFGAALSDFLLARRERTGEGSPLLEELADYHYTLYLAATAADEPGDGFESRLFVRHYTYAVPEIVRALSEDPSAPLPEPKPTTLVIARSLAPPFKLRTHAPTLADLAVLARRQGLELPAPLARLPADELERSEARMVAAGLLVPG